MQSLDRILEAINNNTFYLTAPFRSLKDTLQIKNSLKQGQTNNKTIKVQVKTRQLQLKCYPEKMGFERGFELREGVNISDVRWE